MIILSTLPKNSLGIVKILNVNQSTITKLETLGITIGTKIKLKRIEERDIIIESYIEGNKVKATLSIDDALKILINPI